MANRTYFAVVCSSSMNNLGPFGLLAIAVGVAALFVLVAAIPVLVMRNLITRRPAATHLREWLFYVVGAALLIIAFAGSFLYAKHKGIAEYTVVKWLHIFISALFVFGFAAKKFWHLRKQWKFWATLSALTIAHFALLSRLRWEQAGYFWLVVVVGLPELGLVFFLLGLMFDPNESPTKGNALSGETSLDNSKRR
jgi:hypothetical protein